MQNKAISVRLRPDAKPTKKPHFHEEMGLLPQTEVSTRVDYFDALRDVGIA